MNKNPEIVVTLNQLEESPSEEFPAHVQDIGRILRKFHSPISETQPNTNNQALPVRFRAQLPNTLVVELMSSHPDECLLSVAQADTPDAPMFLTYTGTSIFIQQTAETQPEELAADTPGFGAVHFMSTTLESLHKSLHPENSSAW